VTTSRNFPRRPDLRFPGHRSRTRGLRAAAASLRAADLWSPRRRLARAGSRLPQRAGRERRRRPDQRSSQLRRVGSSRSGPERLEDHRTARPEAARENGHLCPHRRVGRDDL